MESTTNIIPFREIANIGKSVLVKLTGFSPVGSYTTESTRNYSNCNNSCPFYSQKPGLELCPDNIYCKEYCSKVEETVVFSNNVPTKKYVPGLPGRFTHSQIIQFLYIHFLAGKGEIRSHFSVSRAAADLGLCTKTISSNIEKFILEDLIYATKVNSDTYNIYLKDVKNYHLTKEQGGTGYVPVSKELFTELLSIKNVNSLKLEIRKLLKYDALQINRDSTKKGVISFKDMGRFLPGHINYKNIINKVIDGASTIFNLNKIDNKNKIEFEMNPQFDARILKEKKKLDYSIDFAAIFNANALSEVDKETELEDLVQMSFEYGHETVIAAFKKYLKEYWWNNIIINNIGAFVRSLIQRSITNEISLC